MFRTIPQDFLSKKNEVVLVTPRLTRLRNPDRLELVTAEYTIVVQVHVTGLEIDATTIERLLHAPLGVLADTMADHAALRLGRLAGGGVSP
jgi:hypothetical protein